ncbi:uncharacterized protein G2W53_018107 [Senna tora]|uniref:Uncharacterized protein n=1 Tax=Senna tora TaxID=362788 RepID=A0A834TRE1_9FABA|nr:uncharacterized protein G2W53_018107 [Senna tora]
MASTSEMARQTQEAEGVSAADDREPSTTELVPFRVQSASAAHPTLESSSSVPSGDDKSAHAGALLIADKPDGEGSSTLEEPGTLNVEDYQRKEELKADIWGLLELLQADKIREERISISKRAIRDLRDRLEKSLAERGSLVDKVETLRRTHRGEEAKVWDLERDTLAESLASREGELTTFCRREVENEVRLVEAQMALHRQALGDLEASTSPVPASLAEANLLGLTFSTARRARLEAHEVAVNPATYIVWRKSSDALGEPGPSFV